MPRAWSPRRRGSSLVLTLGVAVALVSCAGDGEVDVDAPLGAGDAVWPDGALERGARYLRDRAYRRAVLEASIVDRDNTYSSLRLANYARADGGGWDASPAWNPRVAAVTLGDVGAVDALAPSVALELPDTLTREGLIDLGRRAFEGYPLQITPAYEVALRDADAVDDYGLWVDDRGRVGGLVVTETPTGRTAIATTCASCHARVDDGVLIHGAASPTLDQGRMFYQHELERGSEDPLPEAFLAWGPGHVDPTEDGVDNPTGIPDLRPVRHQNHLNAAATLRNDLLALTVRTETLIITAYGGTRRPPRIVAFAIAYYLWSLGEPPVAGEASAREQRGREVFELTCSRCHHADFTTAAPVELDDVGTDPAAGLSPARGTGYYRIPSLFKVGDRRRLLHRSFLASLEEMFDPARIDDVPGHPFGLDLSGDERADLLAYLATLGWR